MRPEYPPSGDANLTLPNYTHEWDEAEWHSHSNGKQTGTVVNSSPRLEDPSYVVEALGHEAMPGERGWGVPERNIVGVNVGIHPMSDETPNHVYDPNDPFGKWSLSEELVTSPREYRAAFKSKEPRFMQPIERTAAGELDEAKRIEREGREVSAVTYGSAWYKIPHVAKEIPAPYLGPRGTGGSALLAMKASGAERVERILQSCEDRARQIRQKEASIARERSWEAVCARMPSLQHNDDEDDEMLPLKKKLRALSYTHNGQDPRNLFSLYDRDNS